jgi:hypothetical protein
MDGYLSSPATPSSCVNSYPAGPVLTTTEAVEEIRLEPTGAANLLSTAETPMQQLALSVIGRER